MPPYLFASKPQFSVFFNLFPPLIAAPALVLLAFAYYSDKVKMRSPFILAGLTMMLIGFAIAISAAPSGVKYFGTFLSVGGSYAAFPGVMAW